MAAKFERSVCDRDAGVRGITMTTTTDEKDLITHEEFCRKSDSTLSTKRSSKDQLVCKSPRESSGGSLVSVEKVLVLDEQDDQPLLWMGVWQFGFGVLMLVFGGMVIHYDSSLAQLGGGIWAGCLVMCTGITGVLASARDWCPLRSTPQKITHTVFLALSLISLAVAQLVLALAATGAGRDFNNSLYDIKELEKTGTTTGPPPPGTIAILLPLNYPSILANLGLALVCLGEFVAAAISSYRSSRALCPCFRRKKDLLAEAQGNRDALVSSWLGHHSPQVYLVAAPPSHSKLSGGLPVFTIAHPNRATRRLPLIPAPLGSIPSPMIPPTPRRLPARHQKRRKSKSQSRPKSRSKSLEKSMSEVDVAQTYTGLDKTIAEEFIDICDLRNASLCSSSESRSCDCTNTSEEFLVRK